MPTSLHAARPLLAVGELIGTLGIPALGLVLLIIGLVQRSRSSGPSNVTAPQYPYPPQMPPGYPPGDPQQQFGYPPTYPGTYPGNYPSLYPPAAAKKRGAALIIIGALVLAFGLLGVVARLSKHSSSTPGINAQPANQSSSQSTSAQDPYAQTGANLKVGQCINSTAFESRMFLEAHDCSDTMSTYLLAAKGDGSATCPDGKRDGSVYSVLESDAVTLCFEPNMRADKCYTAPEGTTALFMYSAACGSGDFKVTQRLDGSTDVNNCPRGAKAVAFPDPAVLYCIVPASP